MDAMNGSRALILTCFLLLLVQWNSIPVAYAARGLAGAAAVKKQDTWLGPKIERIVIVGERHSGTNYITTTLEMNVKAEVSDTFCAFKHDYQSPGVECGSLENTLVIVMLRNPYDWALAMHKYCWCGGPVMAEKMAAMTFEEFLSQSYIETAVKQWVGEKKMTPCGNVMQCRALKYLNFLNISTWAPNVVYLHHEDIITPERTKEWLANIVDAYQLELADKSLKIILAYKGDHRKQFDSQEAIRNSIWLSPHLPSRNATIRDEVNLVTKYMDMEVERMVGYGPLGYVSGDGIAAAADRIMQIRTMPPV